MFVFDWLVSFAFGSLYASVVTLIPLVAAIPYGIWQGIKWLARSVRKGEDHGNTRTGG